jgi:amidase
MANGSNGREAATEQPDVLGLAAATVALGDGAVRSADLVAACLDRIAETQPVLNAFRSVRADAALEEAAVADRRLERGERLPLLGVPVAIKDDMVLAGDATRRGCAGDFPVEADDGEAARRLRAAGAIIVGKTNLPEFGQWPFTEGTFGQTRNPWNLDRTPGGSSGGSAAAVAAGVVPAALGSDGAGSVRIPAGWTHLVGIKPQRGRISTWPDADAFNGLTSFGPLARTVEDAALLLDAAQGNHPSDRDRPTPPPEPFAELARRGDPGRLRIGLSFTAPFMPVRIAIDEQIRSGVGRLAEVLERLGHTVTPIEPSYGLIGLGFLPRSMAELHDSARRVPDPSALDPRTRSNARVGRYLGGRALIAARNAERRAQERLRLAYRAVDVILAPTTAGLAPHVGAFDGLSNHQTDQRMMRLAPFCWAWNVVGWPGVNVPAGIDHHGVPFGAQLLGAENTEPLLVGLAAQLQEVEGWHHRRPTVR